MSSSSFARDRPAHRLLHRALAVLAREAPVHYTRLARRLAPLTIRCTVGHEVLCLQVVGAKVEIFDCVGEGGFASSQSVDVSSDLACVLALLDGEHTLLGAVEMRRLELRGSAAALGTAAEVCSALVHGLVRCTSAGELLAALRTTCN